MNGMKQKYKHTNKIKNIVTVLKTFKVFSLSGKTVYMKPNNTKKKKREREKQMTNKKRFFVVGSVFIR